MHATSIIKPRFYLFFILNVILVFCTIHVLSAAAAKPSTERPSKRPAPIAIIPKPVSLKAGKGAFLVNNETSVLVADSMAHNDANVFVEQVKAVSGITLRVEGAEHETRAERTISKSKKQSIQVFVDKSLSENAYKLSITPRRATIHGNGAGVFYGLQSLLQLIGSAKMAAGANSVAGSVSGSAAGSVAVPCVEIQDRPRFSWRGMHLDVARHFFPKEVIKRLISLLAIYKMNVFHWHLTDDQGWRIEIKKYPKLTSVAAWRDATLIGHYSDTPHRFDSTRYGGFYTQEDIKEVVAFAAERHITVLPEIEMPGHALAALSAYPELACTAGPFKATGMWGVFDDVFCPSEQTFTFLQDVLTEVMALFPSKYIHVGGDECPKERWKQSEFCQNLIKQQGLKDEHALQSYFIQRIEKFLNANGRQLIGWDEILEGGLAPNAAVMSWRGEQGGIEAAKQRHDVVMSPGSHCYFDKYQSKNVGEPLAIGGYIPLEKVYAYEPVPDELSAAEAKYVLGAQGNVWTEYITTTEKVEYMAFPRICALAEVLWSQKKASSKAGKKAESTGGKPALNESALNEPAFNEFVGRLNENFRMLQRLGVNYAPRVFDANDNVQPAKSGNGVVVGLQSRDEHAELFYTLDGSTPTRDSPRYTAPVNISRDAVFQAAAFTKRDGKDGLQNTCKRVFSMNKATGKPVQLANSPNPSYAAGGAFALVDGQRGLPSLQNWISFGGNASDVLEATVDLKAQTSISRVNIGVFVDPKRWIYPPKSAEILVSEDGKKFSVLKRFLEAELAALLKGGTVIEAATLEANTLPMQTRFVRVRAEALGVIPSGKPGAGNKAWLFADEIRIE